MISFNPGPSKVYPEVKQYLIEAADEGVLSISHRSARFSQIYADMVANCKTKLGVPDNYMVYTFSSATECWSALAEGLVQNASLHIFSGDFGERWYDQSYRLNRRVPRIEMEPDSPFEEVLESEALANYSHDADLVCVTQNETQNGTQVRPEFLKALREKTPHSLLVVDATSSLGGLDLPIAQADVWFASVQKCFGLPAGLGLMFVSPAAVAKMQAVNFDGQYNSVMRVHKNALKNQTTHTPNVLNIFLLKRVLEEREAIASIDQTTKNRAKMLYDYFDRHPVFKPYVNYAPNRSDTVVTVFGDGAAIDRLKNAALEKDLQLGSGYGDLKPVTFRIANFPAHTDQDFERLIAVLNDFS